MSVNVVSPSPEFVAWRGNLSSELQQRMGQLESDATVLRWFDPALVPGLLQTRDYARAILNPLLAAVDNDGDVPPALEERLARQRRWRASDTVTHFLVAEQALHTRVGDTDTTRAQLEMLLRPLPPTVTLGILPRTTQSSSSATNFIAYDDTHVVVETVTGKLVFTDPTNIGDYLSVFDTLGGHAVFGTDAEALIHEALTTHQ
ncbi:DUF5753 domain-containing protein [Nocardia puris]|uniref:DUF5753 domain-containing protein n=1 Tax=Nocardia puris TaxID=208602 RepID=A0A366D8T3_9NOCA|nr:DUF5753 domain-containing protein [Nocardia puris]RBO86462.1 hypothetical protein DFR74_1134 [Nocardia puris]